MTYKKYLTLTTCASILHIELIDDQKNCDFFFKIPSLEEKKVYNFWNISREIEIGFIGLNKCRIVSLKKFENFHSFFSHAHVHFCEDPYEENFLNCLNYRNCRILSHSGQQNNHKQSLIILFHFRSQVRLKSIILNIMTWQYRIHNAYL